MTSSDLTKLFGFVTDWADATGDLFASLKFFAGSLETVSGIVSPK